MEPLDLSSNAKIVLAIVIGFITGFALLKSDLMWRKSVLDILTLKNGRLIKTILFFIGCGAIGFYFFERSGLVNIQVGRNYLWASIIGGAISGVGLVICGFTPLNAVANISTGRIYVLWTILGMLLALPVVKLLDEKFSNYLYSWGDKFNTPSTNSGASFFDVQITSSQKFLSLSNGALITFIICAILIVIVQFTLGDSSESNE